MAVKSWRKRVTNCTTGFLIDHMIAGNKIWVSGHIEYSIVKAPLGYDNVYQFCINNTPERKDFIGVSIDTLIKLLEGCDADIEIKED